MKIGVGGVNVGVRSGQEMLDLARTMEKAGFESAWTVEHVIIPLEYRSKYPYDPSGKMAAPPETPLIDPLIGLSYFAAGTTTLRLGTGVNILPQANPLLLAKQAASLDALSGGRFILGAGLGWLREEYEAMRTPFERRGARFDDYVKAIRKVWSGEVVDHESEFLNWRGFKSYPVPTRVPIVIGGLGRRMAERAATIGDGWYFPSATTEDLAESLQQLEAACDAADRDRSTVEVSTNWDGRRGLEAIEEFADLGVGRLIVPVRSLGANPLESIQRLGEEVVARV